MKKKDYLLLMTLAILPILLVLILVPTQSCFAHEVDWLSQHSTIPDYFRQLFYQSKDLFPDYAAHLQGGINIYALSYYGLFRPDVLISYLLPMVSMETIIITYMILMMSFASCLCFIWLKRKGYTSSLCMFVSILLICSSMFFQSHKQIMFVNYLPFLFMALLAIDKYLIKHKTIWLSIAIFLIILHSYFFSIAAIIICILYYFYMLSKQEKLSLHTFIKKDTLRFLYAIMLAILLAAILLLPTALVILENTKSVANTTLSDVLTMSLDLDGLLYDPYGCGLTMIAWISISLGLYSKQTRNLSILLIVSFVFPLIAYLLNGTLYARSKILIVYLPLVLLLICDVLQQLKHKQIKIKPSLLFLVIIPILFYTGNKLIMLSDAIFTLLILWIYQNKTKMHLLFGNLLYPLLCVALINSPSEFLTHESYVKATSKEKQTLIEQYQKQGKGRSDDLSSPLANSNRLYSLHEYKTTAYTSTYLSLYNTFYYDIMKNPISIVNRVAMLANNNIFFQGFMGVDTIYTNKKVPIGYEVKKQNKQIKIAENKNVLPLGYATSDLISDETFDQLTYPYTLDTLYNNAIVKQGDHHYQSQMKPVQLEYQVVKKTKQLEYETKENRVRIHAKQDSQLSLDINQDLTNQIILISFDVNDVENAKQSDTAITINQVRNKLSRESAPYPNGNTRFTYILSSNEAIKTLNIKFTKGTYTLDNIAVYTLDYDVIKERVKQVEPLIQEKTTGKEVMKGHIHVKKDGYFITSLPYQKGYSVWIDGKEVEAEIVNKAFLGVPISAGKHTITIAFHAPAKRLGTGLSMIALILLLCNGYIERRKKQ